MNSNIVPNYYIINNCAHNNTSNKRYILIDSRCRANYTNPTDNFVFSLNDTIKITKYLKIVYSSIPNTFYLINSLNNTFHFIDENNNRLLITLKQGNYDVNSLALEIQTEVR